MTASTGFRRRRLFLALGVLLAVPRVAWTEKGNRSFRIGFLGNSTAALETNLFGPFREGLAALGYVDGKNCVIETRWAGGKYERFPALIAELVAQKVDVLVTAGTPAALAVKKTAPSTPLVMIAVGDPVATGLIHSLARPGGNITGVSSIARDLEGKRLELLREIVPDLSRAAVLWNPNNLFHAGSVRQTQQAAKALGLSVEFFEARTSDEVADALAAIAKLQPHALAILADRVYLHERKRIADFALQQRLPNVVTHQELVDSGALMSFGPNYPEMHRRAATYVDKILNGARPGDLPVEQPTKFELVLNLRTARALDLKIPQSILLRADRLIQ